MTEDDQFKDFEAAVERTSWVKKGTGRVNFGFGGSGGGGGGGSGSNGGGGSSSSSKWENCTLELEQTGTQRGEVDFGTLSIFGAKNKNKEHLSLADITCVSRVQAEKTLAVFTPSRSLTLTPILLKFSGDLEMESW